MKTYIATMLVVLVGAMCVPVRAGLSLDHVDGEGSTPNHIMVGTDINFHVQMTNDFELPVMGMTNGFRVWSPYGANWRPITLDTAQINWSSMFDLIVQVNSYSVTGSGADTMGLAAAMMSAGGFPSGHSDVILSVGTEVYPESEGMTLCFDSSFFPPANPWRWVVASVDVWPSWDGPHCFVIEQTPNLPPVITNNPVSLVFDHCEEASYDYDAADPEGDPISFSIVSGPGAITDDGVWTYQPNMEDVGVDQYSILRGL